MRPMPLSRTGRGPHRRTRMTPGVHLALAWWTSRFTSFTAGLTAEAEPTWRWPEPRGKPKPPASAGDERLLGRRRDGAAGPGQHAQRVRRQVGVHGGALRQVRVRAVILDQGLQRHARG